MEITLNPHPQKKVYLETLGCQSNVVESDHVAGLLIREGYSLTRKRRSGRHPFQYLFHPPARRGQGLFPPGRIGRLEKRTSKAGSSGVLGCMATSYKDHLMDRAPHVDMVVGPDQYLKVRRGHPRSLPGRAEARCWRISTRSISPRTTLTAFPSRTRPSWRS